MAQKIAQATPPKGLTRWLFRLPIWFYRFGFGWVLGQRFVLINHVGRKSGKHHQTVVEVIKHEFETDTYYIVSGYGIQANWYRNLLNDPNVIIQVGRKKLEVRAVSISSPEGGAIMVDYAQRHPVLAQRLMNFLGYQVNGADEDYYAIGRDNLKFIAFFRR